jgi:endonuclease/exonuclease/phosphatase family metal-dependent hydrolase
MVIDGRDSRGIDVGILSRFEINRMRSRVHEPVFSRDCPEYAVRISADTELIIMPNHFASKGSDPTSTGRRNKQALRVREIYEGLANPLVVIAGDLNDHPGGGSLTPLLADTNLNDVMSLPEYGGEFPGTYKQARAEQKLDYLLLSPPLAQAVTGVDCFRKGFYAPTKWDSFENITSTTKDRNQASDHHCLWADLELL